MSNSCSNRSIICQNVFVLMMTDSFYITSQVAASNLIFWKRTKNSQLTCKIWHISYIWSYRNRLIWAMMKIGEKYGKVLCVYKAWEAKGVHLNLDPSPALIFVNIYTHIYICVCVCHPYHFQCQFVMWLQLLKP